MDEILKYAIENGIIDMSYIQEKIEMNKREELLKKHPWKISQGKDGKWRTYLPDTEKGRKMVKKISREAIEEEVIAYWRAEAENPDIKEVFEEWNDRRLGLKKISASTHERNTQIFERHYKDFGKRKIKNVDPEEYEEFLEEQIPQYSLTAKAFSNLKTVTRGFLKRAKKRKLINFDVEALFNNLDISDVDFKKRIVIDEKEVYSEEELPKVFDYLQDNLDIKNLGIMLMFLTGIRVGELVSLKHDDFHGTIFKVQRTETRIPKADGSGYDYKIKDFPKTEAGVRTAIIPSDYSWVAEKLRLSNPFGEYIFVENEKRMTTNCIRKRMMRMCKNLGIVQKSPHKARKTYGSILLDNHIDNRLVTDVMGHTDISVTEGYYHRSRRTMEKKTEIINSIPEFKAK